MSDESAPRPTEIVVRCDQRGEGVPEGGKHGVLSQRQGSLDRRLLVPCANPACKKGGFLLRPEIDEAIAARRDSVSVEKPCAGYTGALRSERGYGERCPNVLRAEVELTYPPARKR